ncbi:TIGR03086 family protein [Kineococcus glutinatus]|uniref:Mycothiol maleylpyruvate isomerase-like protein n=1 Tax=Kineococcus glutinatus TaxID=1070872 RepID=A0ABP9HLJ3_9ACTN
MSQTSTHDVTAQGADAIDPRPLAVRALEVFTDLVRQVPDEAWDRGTRGVVTTSDPSSDPSLRELVGYHAYDDAWIPALLAGRTMAEVGEDAFGTPFGGEVLGDDVKAGFAATAAAAVAAVRGLDDLERTVHCSFGDFSARDYLWQVVSFRGLRAVELARLLGLDEELPAELVAGMLAYFEVHAEQWRAWGVFGPAVQAPAGATAQERLLALTGRAPR